MQEEIDSLLAYSTFTYGGHIKFKPGYQNIHIHFVFAVNHYLRHLSRLVAGGYLTDPNTTDSKYSSFLTLSRKRIAIAAG
jgi:hypothetical protein